MSRDAIRDAIRANEQLRANYELNKKDVMQFYGVDGEEKPQPPAEYYSRQDGPNYVNDEKLPRDADVVEEVEPGIRKVVYHNGVFLQGGRFSLAPLDAIFEKINAGKACVILITGEAGSSKSWTALTLAELIDPKFNPDVQIVWDRSQFLMLISDDSPLRPKQVIICDESAYIAGSRRWYEDAQKLLMEQLTSVRFKNLVIIFIAINAELLDNLIRNNLVTFRITTEERGIATLYQTTHHKFMPNRFPKKVGKLYLKIPDYDKCKSPTCLQCRYSGLLKSDWNRRTRWIEDGFKLCLVKRARMERLKRLRVEEANVAAREKMQVAKRKVQSDAEIADNLLPFVGEMEKSKSGKMKIESIMAVASEKLGTDVSRVKSYQIRAKLERKTEKAGGV